VYPVVNLTCKLYKEICQTIFSQKDEESITELAFSPIYIGILKTNYYQKFLKYSLLSE